MYGNLGPRRTNPRLLLRINLAARHRVLINVRTSRPPAVSDFQSLSGFPGDDTGSGPDVAAATTRWTQAMKTKMEEGISAVGSANLVMGSYGNHQKTERMI